MSSLSGYVKIHRKLLQWGWYQDNVVKSVWLHLLLTAAFKPSSWQGIVIEPGQCIIGLSKMATELGFSVQQTRTALDKLRSTNEITTKSTNRYTLVTLVNWEDYQLKEKKSTSKSTSTSTNEQQTNNKQSTNNQQHRKNVKNDKNVKKYTPAGEFVPSGRFEESGEEYMEIDGKKYNRYGQELNAAGYPVLDYGFKERDF